MALKMLLKKCPKKSVVPPSGNIKKTVNIPAKKHGAPSAHTIESFSNYFLLDEAGYGKWLITSTPQSIRCPGTRMEIEMKHLTHVPFSSMAQRYCFHLGDIREWNEIATTTG
jgi:hypothetical protein